MLIGTQMEATVLGKSTMNAFIDKNILCVTFRPYKSHNLRMNGGLEGKEAVHKTKALFFKLVTLFYLYVCMFLFYERVEVTKSKHFENNLLKLAK